MINGDTSMATPHSYYLFYRSGSKTHQPIFMKKWLKQHGFAQGRYFV